MAWNIGNSAWTAGDGTGNARSFTLNHDANLQWVAACFDGSGQIAVPAFTAPVVFDVAVPFN
jgi:hypothetical protein